MYQQKYAIRNSFWKILGTYFNVSIAVKTLTNIFFYIMIQRKLQSSAWENE
jgi:hypothetical protein